MRPEEAPKEKAEALVAYIEKGCLEDAFLLAEGGA